MAAGIDGRKMEVIRLAPDERAKLLDASTKYIDEWIEKGGAPAKGVLDDYRGLVAKYAAERDAKGYPWTR